MNGEIEEQDKVRYLGKPPKFQKYLRKTQESKGIIRRVWTHIYHFECKKNMLQIPESIQLGGGAYFGHAFCIVINPDVVIGMNCNIHGGVTIGQENRGKRKGVPIIGNDVWIGMHTVIVGKVRIGNDVLIAPNSYVNCDIPDHSIVYGNPCVIKHCENATRDYINNRVV